MKEQKRTPIVYSLAVLALVPVSVCAQDSIEAEAALPPVASVTTTQDVETIQVAPHVPRAGVRRTVEVVQDEQSLRREIEALEAASARKRAELEQRLVEIKRHRELEAARAKKATTNSRTPNLDPTAQWTQNRWMIGVQVSPTPSDGVKVEQVIDGTPAKKSGIQNGDVIESVNGIRVRQVGSLNAVINAAADQELKIGVRRGGERIEIAVTPSKIPGPKPPAVPPRAQPQKANPSFFGGDPALRGYPYDPAPQARAQVFDWIAPGTRDSREGRRGPDTAELQALKKEIADLRQLVEKVADTLADEKGEPEAGGGEEDSERADDDEEN